MMSGSIHNQTLRLSTGYPGNSSIGVWSKTLLILSALLMAGCQPETTEVRVDTTPFTVELARTQQERRQGLMYRAHLPEGHGMLFIQPAAAPVAFWMKNTYIPLDLLYFDADGRLLEIHADVPPCTTPRCPTYPSTGAVKYVLEINGGAAARLGLEPGDRLSLPGQ